MKRFIIILLAQVTIAAVLSVGVCSCGKDVSNDDTTSGDNTACPAPGEGVDLGLSSGLLWADRNVGASSPEDYGYYFAWGETQTKSYYDWITYRYVNDSLRNLFNNPYFNDSLHNQLTKYCFDSSYGYNGFTDNLLILQPEDDPATVYWGDGWRTPTVDEWRELFVVTANNYNSERIRFTRTARNGVPGCLVTAPNGNSIFLPASGELFRNMHLCVANFGEYMSASLATEYNPDYAWRFDFGPQNVVVSYSERTCGLPVRPVRSAR